MAVPLFKVLCDDEIRCRRPRLKSQSIKHFERFFSGSNMFFAGAHILARLSKSIFFWRKMLKIMSNCTEKYTVVMHAQLKSSQVNSKGLKDLLNKNKIDLYNLCIWHAVSLGPCYRKSFCKL